MLLSDVTQSVEQVVRDVWERLRRVPESQLRRHGPCSVSCWACAVEKTIQRTLNEQFPGQFENVDVILGVRTVILTQTGNRIPIRFELLPDPYLE